jgi:hypothetical protein
MRSGSSSVRSPPSPSAARRLNDTNVFLVTVDGDVPDGEQSQLRLRGLYHGGHVGMSHTGDIRAGTCETSFAVLADTTGDARAHAECELRAIGLRVIRVEQAG